VSEVSEVSEVVVNEVLLGSIAEIRVKSEDEELLRLQEALLKEKLATAQQLLELKDYFDLEESTEDLEDIEWDIVKQLLQSELLDYRAKISDRDIAQLRDYFRYLSRYSWTGKNKITITDSVTFIKELVKKVLYADLQYYTLYYYRWTVIYGKDKLKDIVKPSSLVKDSKKQKLEQKRKELAKKILQLKEQGLSIRQIAQKLGLSKSTVHKYLKKYAKL